MDNPTYLALSRQSGLLQEMQVVANNIGAIGAARCCQHHNRYE